ncbi:uncharacterized protein BKA78DRAFT_6067 [Phyllosticta capitalensis]|uniref:uncharacterized protein n=1 Tax=Phyllosticta capitalensis TaxID=121624 RepID=UPI00312E9ED9
MSRRVLRLLYTFESGGLEACDETSRNGRGFRVDFVFGSHGHLEMVGGGCWVGSRCELKLRPGSERAAALSPVHHQHHEFIIVAINIPRHCILFFHSSHQLSTFLLPNFSLPSPAPLTPHFIPPSPSQHHVSRLHPPTLGAATLTRHAYGIAVSTV